jgi:hypothetical protein
MGVELERSGIGTPSNFESTIYLSQSRAEGKALIPPFAGRALPNPGRHPGTSLEIAIAPSDDRSLLCNEPCAN